MRILVEFADDLVQWLDYAESENHEIIYWQDDKGEEVYLWSTDDGTFTIAGCSGNLQEVARKVEKPKPMWLPCWNSLVK